MRGLKDCWFSLCCRRGMFVRERSKEYFLFQEQTARGRSRKVEGIVEYYRIRDRLWFLYIGFDCLLASSSGINIVFHMFFGKFSE